MSQLNVDTLASQTGSNVTVASGHSLKSDTINEATAGSGVTIDGVLIKDGEVDGVDVSNITGGKILQVVSTTDDTAYSNSGTSYTQILGTTITPSSTSSKILIIVHAQFSCSQDTYGGATLLRGGTEISKSDETTGGGNANQYTVSINHRDGDAQWESEMVSINFLDTPSTTSATTYYLGFRKDYGTQINVNRPYATNNNPYHWNTVSTMTLMEVAG